MCLCFNQYDETVKQLFSTFNQVVSLWTENKFYFVNNIKLIVLRPQIDNLGNTNTNDKYFITQNLILIILKFYVYRSRGSGNLSFSTFFHKLVNIKKKKKLEKGTDLISHRNLAFLKRNGQK